MVNEAGSESDELRCVCIAFTLRYTLSLRSRLGRVNLRSLLRVNLRSRLRFKIKWGLASGPLRGQLVAWLLVDYASLLILTRRFAPRSDFVLSSLSPLHRKRIFNTARQANIHVPYCATQALTQIQLSISIHFKRIDITVKTFLSLSFALTDPAAAS